MRVEHNPKLNFLKAVGQTLIILGSGTLLFLIYAVVKVVLNPSEFELSRLVLSSLAVTEPLLSGNINGQVFVINAAKPLQYVLFAFVGLFLIHILIAICNSVIGGGIALTRFVAMKEYEKSQNKQNII